MTKGSDYQRQARAGLLLLSKRLEKLAEDADKVGYAAGASTFRSDADSVQAVVESGKPLPEPEEAKAGDRVMLRNGLRLLAHNLKTAAGTVTALGRDELADEFRAEAEHIEQHVLPGLEEQVPLRLEPAAANA